MDHFRGVPPPSLPGCGTDADRRHRGRPGEDPAEIGGLSPRRGADCADPETLQAGQPGVPGNRHHRPGRRGPDRGARIHRHRRPLLHRERGTDDGVRLCRQKSGGEDPPGRRLQTTDVALQLPGNGGRGAETPQEGRRQNGDAGRDRSDEHDGRRSGRAVQRHPPDRRTQHPEFLPPATAASRSSSSGG